jgi:16S rRNA (adenine1518-N6/adenine1519-N6)-dimethyltransferase
MDAVAALPPLREIIAAHGLRAEKKLGQNFLLDLNLTARIARAAGDLSGVHAFEIGPGPGGLTRALLGTGAAHVTAIEYDPRAVAALQSLVTAAAGRLTLVQGDALETDLTALAPGARRAIVANLPYNISTVLLLAWLRQLAADPAAYQSLTLMFQREVADRLTAAAGSKAYGRLSVIAQWLCAAKRQFDVPASAFTPPPKVTSSIVSLVPLALAAPRGVAQFAAMEKLTAAAFGQRRKMLRGSLRAYLPVLEQAGIDPQLRAEDVPVEGYAEMVRILAPQGGSAP